MALSMTNNAQKSRFELIESGETAYADYKNEGGVLTIKYVFAPEALRGTGAAGRLMNDIAAHARDQNLKILPLCGYAAS
ncbi:MAG: N-acetyltransferase, partial [Micavibrio aeruginosavorus]